MKVYLLPITVLFAANVTAQNVGINTTTPETRLHIKGAADTTLLTIESPTTLAADKSVGMLFKNGDFYTAGIRTIGTSASTARIGVYTMAPGFGANEMKESMTITNDGNVGIGYIAPLYKLAVNGTGYFYNDGSGQADVAAVKGNSLVNSRFSPGVTGTGVSTGIVGNANTVAGIGILGYNNSGNAALSYVAGAGIQGFSSGGHGIAGSTTKTASAGVYGATGTPGAWGGRFVGSGGALALNTAGPLSFTGIGEGAGKVLTCDANGNATWQTPAGNGNPSTPIAFSAYLSGQTGATPGTYHTLSGLVTEYQFGESFNGGEGLFIAPADGLYQFTVRIEFSVTGTNPIYSSVGFRVNGTTAVGGEFFHTTPGTANSWEQSLTYTKTMNLSQGANVQVIYKLTQAGTNSFTLLGDESNFASFFSGIKLL